MVKIGFGAVTAVALALSCVSCVDLGARAYAGFMQSDVTGDFALDSSAGGANLSSIKNDVENQLGIDDESRSLWLKAEIDPPSWGRFSASAFRYDESGNGTLSAPFGDIPAGTDVATSLAFTNLKVAWTYDLLDVALAHVSPGIALDVFDIETRVNSTSPLAFEEVDTIAPVPMLYLQAGAEFGFVGFDVEAGWMSIDLDDADGDYLDLEAMARVNIAPKVELTAGYRFISIDGDGRADGQRFDAELELQGFFVGGGFNF